MTVCCTLDGVCVDHCQVVMLPGHNVFAAIQEWALCPHSGTAARREGDKEALERQLGRSPCMRDTGSPSGR